MVIDHPRSQSGEELEILKRRRLRALAVNRLVERHSADDLAIATVQCDVRDVLVAPSVRVDLLAWLVINPIIGRDKVRIARAESLIRITEVRCQLLAAATAGNPLLEFFLRQTTGRGMRNAPLIKEVHGQRTPSGTMNDLRDVIRGVDFIVQRQEVGGGAKQVLELLPHLLAFQLGRPVRRDIPRESGNTNDRTTSVTNRPRVIMQPSNLTVRLQDAVDLIVRAARAARLERIQDTLAVVGMDRVKPCVRVGPQRFDGLSPDVLVGRADVHKFAGRDISEPEDLTRAFGHFTKCVGRVIVSFNNISDILQDTNQPRLAVARLHVRLAKDASHASVRLADAVLDAIRNAFRDEAIGCTKDSLAILGKDDLLKRRQRGADLLGFESENAVEFVGPPGLKGIRVGFPMTDPCESTTVARCGSFDRASVARHAADVVRAAALQQLDLDVDRNGGTGTGAMERGKSPRPAAEQVGGVTLPDIFRIRRVNIPDMHRQEFVPFIPKPLAGALVDVHDAAAGQVHDEETLGNLIWIRHDPIRRFR